MPRIRPTRPNLNDHFQSKINVHVFGMMSQGVIPPPPGITVRGDVTDTLIVATDRDGNEWRWIGGRYASRKINGCYAPLMPKPVPEAARKVA